MIISHFLLCVLASTFYFTLFCFQPTEYYFSGKLEAELGDAVHAAASEVRRFEHLFAFVLSTAELYFIG